MDYKSTLNLPATNFPMKASLAQNEPKILDSWSRQEIYKKIRQKGKGLPKYILHDGPPYANGNIHIGHALNKILKDIIIRFKTMRGFDSPYIPGWDCHGMPIEHQLFKDLNITKEMIPQIDFRKKAYDYALKFVGIQKEEFIRLGVFGDWENPYLTLSKKYEYGTVKVLSELIKQGYIYRGLKPVNWCTTCETALAEAEVEYEDKTSPSIYVKFKVVSEFTGLPDNRISEFYLVVWTTTPWTLFSNTAVAVHPSILYAVVITEKGALVIAKNLIARAFKDIGIAEANVEIVKEIWGKDLAEIVYEHPFLKDGLERKIVLADYVSGEEGTGLVHIAPGHGQEDYAIGLKYNLPILMPVEKSGRFNSSCGDLSGENVLKSNPKIIEKLKSQGSLLFLGQIQHSYPHCWRCKNPVIFRATKQWFLNIGHNALRNKLSGIIENDIEFVPASGKERIKAMVESRPDWCLSRQRYWGVPIPSVRCWNCSEEILDSRVVDNFARKIKEEGSDCWFKEDIKIFLPENFVCPHCSGDKFFRSEDILDVWFDSGSSYEAVLLADSNLEFPAQLYLEGTDQHRGWFQASLIPSTALRGRAPFKAALTHGFVVDGDGRKMSKSIGNVVSPQEIIKDYGSDILRLWCASSNYSEDVRVSKDILLRLTDAYRKIRNTIRFLLGNLSDFSANNAVAYESLLEIDRYSLSLTHNLLKKTTQFYENFEFYKIYQEVYQFCVLSMSNFYLDILKDRLYTFKKDGAERRSAQTVMYEILLILNKILAPILSFTAEEIWQYLPLTEGGSESVHLAPWPQIKEKYIDDGLENKWYNFIQFRVKVLKAIEEKRAGGLIGSSLEAQVILGISAENSFLKDFGGDLAQFFIVSEVLLKDADNSYIEVHKAQGGKCPRCWNYSRKIGENKDYPEVCPKCVQALLF